VKKIFDSFLFYEIKRKIKEKIIFKRFSGRNNCFHHFSWICLFAFYRCLFAQTFQWKKKEKKEEDFDKKIVFSRAFLFSKTE